MDRSQLNPNAASYIPVSERDQTPSEQTAYGHYQVAPIAEPTLYLPYPPELYPPVPMPMPMPVPGMIPIQPGGTDYSGGIIQTGYPSEPVDPPWEIRHEPGSLMSQAFGFIRHGKAEQAACLFRQLLGDPQQHIWATIGLCRALLRLGGHERLLEAQSLLETLKLSTPCLEVGNRVLSACGDIDLTLVRVYQAREFWAAARNLLQAMVQFHCSSLELNDCGTLCGHGDTDMMRVRLYESQGDYLRAQSLLQAMAMAKRPPLTKNDLSLRCHHFSLDLARACMQAQLGNTEGAMNLLQEVAQASADKKHWPMSSKDLDLPCGRSVLDRHRVTLLIQAGRYGEVKTLLTLLLRGKRIDHSQPILSGKPELDRLWVQVLEEQGVYAEALQHLQIMATAAAREHGVNLAPGERMTPCGDDTTDLQRVYMLQLLECDAEAQLLLQNMGINKRHAWKSFDPASPCGDFAIDAAQFEILFRYDRPKAAELLRNMALVKCSTQEEQTALLASPNHPCGHFQTDLLRVRNYIEQGELAAASVLLQALAQVQNQALQTGDTAQPSGHYRLDILRAELLDRMKQPDAAMGLLQAMACQRNTELGAGQLTGACEHLDIDLARARALHRRCVYGALDALVENCRRIYPFRPEFLELALVSLAERQQWDAFDRAVAQITAQSPIKPSSHCVQLACAIRHFLQALHAFESGQRESGEVCARAALAAAEKLCEKHPNSAAALTQKARCLRLLQQNEKEWQELLRKACIIDPESPRRVRDQNWYELEQQVLKQLAAPVTSSAQDSVKPQNSVKSQDDAGVQTRPEAER